jgi:CheY-like chemotaxis protein
MKKIEGLQCILLIDDDDATNFVHEIIIEKAGIDTHVQVAKNGYEALKFLSKKGDYSNEIKFPQPGIIFLDINMPRMNGWEFLEAYKMLPDEQKGKIVIAMLTTSLSLDDEKRANNYMGDDLREFLRKPLTVENLNDIVAKYFEQ